jgi:hypothetical protein
LCSAATCLAQPAKGPEASHIAAAAALDESIGSDWVRVQYDEKNQPLAMQTAIVRYGGQSGSSDGGSREVLVDLIGAVHVGDAAYYDELNNLFSKYDALLYELVAPQGTVVERGRRTSNGHPVGALQNGMKTMLALEHQLEKIDYARPNFVHADMSPEQFAQAMRDRNEGWLQMYFRLLGAAMAQKGGTPGNFGNDGDILAALFAKDRPRRLKILLAKQLSEMESLMVSFGGDRGSAIITDRNKIALKVLKDQLGAGKDRLGIFYGAGHLRDMHERLLGEFGLKPLAVTWVTAWNLTESN